MTLISAQKVLFFQVNRLEGFECKLEIHVYRNNAPLDIRGLDFQLRAINNGGPALNQLLDTSVTGSPTYHKLRLLKATPAAALLPLIGGKSTAKYTINCTRAGEAGRKLLAQINAIIDPTPSSAENSIYTTGTLDPEPLRIDLDGDPEVISGGLEDYTVEYDQLSGDLFNMQSIVDNLNVAQALFTTVDHFSDLLALPNPATKNFVMVEFEQNANDDSETFPAGQYLLQTNGRITYCLDGREFRAATPQP